LTDLANTIGESPYFNINATYEDSNNHPVSNVVQLSGSAINSYSHGHTLSQADIAEIVSDAILQNHLPNGADPNGMYFVLTSADVTVDGYCDEFCAWHDWMLIGGQTIKFAFVGNPMGCPTPGACAQQVESSPNDNPAADAMASLIVHELNATATDPRFDGWFDPDTLENADKCAWLFSPMYTAPNGSLANIHLGSGPTFRHYLLEANWNVGAHQCCRFALTSNVGYKYVDANNTNPIPDGTATNPFPTVAQGVAAVPNGGDLVIRIGAYNEALTLGLGNKAMRVKAWNGPARLGSSSPPSPRQ
jgi:hypothetical protein